MMDPCRSMFTGLGVAMVWISGCAEPPPPQAPEPEPVPAPTPAPEPVPPAPEPAVDPPIHECGQDPAKESPIVEGELGQGERVVRLINNSGSTIQARILDASLEPAVTGTLHVPSGTIGEFHVPEGQYVVRYRHGSSCEVRRGATLKLTGSRAGVEIAIKAHFSKGTDSRMKTVKEPL